MNAQINASPGPVSAADPATHKSNAIGELGDPPWPDARHARRIERPAQRLVVAAVCLLFAAPLASAGPNSPIRSFNATALSGEKITDAKRIGRPTILIVTPSKAAAADTRKWAQAMRENLDQKSIRIRDVLAIDLPFFMSESDAMGRAKEKIPARYYDQTWLLDETSLETALDIPTQSANAYVIVMDSKGQVIARVNGAPTEERISQVKSAVRSLK